MTWPTSADYDEAVQNLGRSMSDPELRDGQAVLTPLALPMLWSGGFADVYKIHNARTGKTWALKFFKRQIAGQADRYRHISAHLQRARLPFMVDFQYLDEGVRIRGEWFPVLKMHWVEGGIPLNTFVESHLHRPRLLHDLLGLWVKMARLLRQKQIAHADLQHDNVLLVPRSDGNLALKLIDYDGMHIPALEGAPSGEIGLGAYQHPQRKREGIYSAEVDRFSHLAIYCAIHCLTVEREKLWSRFNNGSNLLFKEQDFNHPTDSEVFQTLWKLPDTACRALVGRLVLACPPSPLHAVPLLDEVTNGHVLPLTPAEERAVDAILQAGATVVPPPPIPERVAEVDTVPLLKLVESRTPRPRRAWPTPVAIVRRVDQWFGQATGRPRGRAHKVLRVTALAAPLVMLTLLTAGLWRGDHPGDNSGASRPVVQSSSTPARPAAAASTLPKEMTNSIGMKLVLIPAGEFDMGSPQKEVERLLAEAKQRNVPQWYIDHFPGEAPQHRVRLTSAFYLGACEVTVGQFRQFAAETGYLTEGEKDGKGGFGSDAGQWVQKREWTWRQPGFRQSDNHPVVHVSWNDAVAFCAWLSRKEGTTYRLPTEAQWEYACRAGSTTKWFFGNKESDLGQYAWYGGNSQGRTHSVGEKKLNTLGLYDIYGNVFEWCADWYGGYTNTPVDDPTGPATGSKRALRGGGWSSHASDCRSAYRGRSEPVYRTFYLGFRAAAVPSGSK